MPAFTTIALATTAAASAAASGMSIVEGRKRQKEAEAALEGYERQELRNVYAGLAVPTSGIELRKQQIEQNVATQTAALSRAGARGLVGGLPQVQAYSEQAFAQLGGELEQSMFRIQQMIAQDEARIQGMRERREEADIAGLGAEIQAGRQQFYGGVQQAIGSAGQFGQAIAGGAGGRTETTAPVTAPSLAPQPVSGGFGGPTSFIGGREFTPGTNPYAQFGQLPTRI